MREVFEAWIKLFQESKKLSQALATEQAWREAIEKIVAHRGASGSGK